jgi:DNA topoisomerase-6 subunit B
VKSARTSPGQKSLEFDAASANGAKANGAKPNGNGQPHDELGQSALSHEAVDHGRGKRRATAESMAAKQRDISVSEFFAKNRHLLGFDHPRKALLTRSTPAKRQELFRKFG